MNLTALDLEPDTGLPLDLELDTGLPEKALRLPDILSPALSLHLV